MSQEDMDVANGSGSVVRADINAQLDAIATNHSGASAPSPTFANQPWMDTSTNIFKQRDNANTTWVNVASKVGAVWIPYNSGLLIAVPIAAGGSVLDPYDIPFNAGYAADMTAEDLVVQTYGEIIVTRVGTFTGESGFLETVGTGAKPTVDIEKNGTSIYTTKPEFALSSTSLTAGAIKSDGTEDFVAGDRITFKVTQIGSTIAGARMRFSVIAGLA